jgi:hypothetical protein
MDLTNHIITMVVRLCPLALFHSLFCYMSNAFFYGYHNILHYLSFAVVHHLIFFHYIPFVVVISKSHLGLTCHITILVDYYLSKARLCHWFRDRYGLRHPFKDSERGSLESFVVWWKIERG